MCIFPLDIMSTQEALIFCFNLKKSAAESHRKLVETYSDNALSKTTYRYWFCRVKSAKRKEVGKSSPK